MITAGTEGRKARIKGIVCSWAVLLGAAPTWSAAGTATDEEAIGRAGSKPTLAEIVVFGRDERQIGKAAAASDGSVGGADLSVRPLLRVAELLEVVPGLIAAQHSGSGKANQYFLRGFQLDHGTDFTSYVDAVPWNLRTHGHGQGYLDVNGLIPEVVDRIDYRKGPYRADIGDFSMAGASFISTIDHFDRPFVGIEAGGYGWRRIAGGTSRALGAGNLTVAGQWKTYDGPWQLPEDLRHGSIWIKYSAPTERGKFTATLSGYHASWHPTEQAPEASFGTVACADAYCSLDPTAYGVTDRWIATAQIQASAWRAAGYLQFYDWHMSSNPTYDFQINQFDRRFTAGGSAERALMDTATLRITVGTELRHDAIGNVGVDHTDEGAFQYNVSRNAVREDSTALYSEATWAAMPGLRLMAGLRGDYYRFDVTAKTANSSAGSRSDRRISPKLGFAYSPGEKWEIYGNWGKGFHSNDARGVVNTVSPVAGLVKGMGYEAGARVEVGKIKLSAAYWWLTLSSELIFVGDSNAVEPRGGSRRNGFELVSFWRPADWLGIDAVYAASNAHYTDLQHDPDYDPLVEPRLIGRNVEGSVKSAGELGISAITDPWELSARLRYLGAYPLVPSGTKNAGSEITLNLRAAYRTRRITLSAEILNALGRDGKDIVYYYPAFVPGILPPGTEQITRLSRPAEPRTCRFGIKFSL